MLSPKNYNWAFGNISRTSGILTGQSFLYSRKEIVKISWVCRISYFILIAEIAWNQIIRQSQQLVYKSSVCNASYCQVAKGHKKAPLELHDIFHKITGGTHASPVSSSLPVCCLPDKRIFQYRISLRFHSFTWAFGYFASYASSSTSFLYGCICWYYSSVPIYSNMTDNVLRKKIAAHFSLTIPVFSS